MRALLLLVVVLGFSSATSQADQAFFSADGKTVTFVPKIDTGYLIRLDLTTSKQRRLVIGADAAQDEVTSLCRGGDGEALFTTAKGVYVLDDKGTRKLSVAPVKADWPMDSLAAAPASMKDVGDWLFISASEADNINTRSFYSRKPGSKDFKKVFCRRVARVENGVFAPDGRFFFAGEGDLWEGSFDVSSAGDDRDATLVAARIAPLAMMNTDEANGGNLWVDQVMLAGKVIYVRLRGHGMSEIVRVPMHPVPALDEKGGANLSTQDSYRYQGEMLAKAEVIPLEQGEIRIAAAAVINGSEKLFYRASDGEGNIGLYLWDRATGKAAKVGFEKDKE